MPPAIKMSAIVVSWNRKDDLRRCLDSLLGQKRAAFEIIVVDNGSTDGTLEMLQGEYGETVRVLPMGKNLGPARARNIGLAEARGEFVLFMDSDAELLTPGALDKLARPLERDYGLAAIGAVICKDRECGDVWFWGGRMDPRYFVDMAVSRGPIAPVELLSTWFGAMKKRVVEEAGGFDPWYHYIHEDTDLFIRIRRMGYEFAVDPDVRVFHNVYSEGRRKSTPFQRACHLEKRRIYMFLKLRGLIPFLLQLRGTRRHFRHFLSVIDVPPFSRWQELYLCGVLPLSALWLYPRARRARGRRVDRAGQYHPARHRARQGQPRRHGRHGLRRDAAFRRGSRVRLSTGCRTRAGLHG